MQPIYPTFILRHRKENLKKCSLRGLESNKNFQFFTYPRHSLPNLENYFLLTLDAPLLTLQDQDKGLFLIDSTWKYSQIMARISPFSAIICRSLPPCFRTAYPRRQDDCPHPELGLASIEAL